MRAAGRRDEPEQTERLRVIRDVLPPASCTPSCTAPEWRLRRRYINLTTALHNEAHATVRAMAGSDDRGVERGRAGCGRIEHKRAKIRAQKSAMCAGAPAAGGGRSGGARGGNGGGGAGGGGGHACRADDCDMWLGGRIHCVACGALMCATEWRGSNEAAPWLLN